MRLPKFILLFFYCFTLFQSQAQDTLVKPLEFSLVAYWSLGDTFQYESVKGTKRFKNGRVTDSTATTTELTLVVVDSSAVSYGIRAIQNADLKIMQSLGLSDSDLDSLASILANLHMEYETDEMGAFTGFRNREKMYQAFSLMWDSFMRQKKKDLTPKEQDRLEEMLQIRKSQAYFEAKLLQEIKNMHKFYGLTYPVDSTIYVDQILPNPLDTTVVFTVPNEILVSMPEDWGGLVRLEDMCVYENEQALAMVRSYVGPKLFEELRREYELHPPHFETYSSYAFYPEVGVLESMHVEVNMYMGGELVSQEFIDVYLH